MGADFDTTLTQSHLTASKKVTFFRIVYCFNAPANTKQNLQKVRSCIVLDFSAAETSLNLQIRNLLYPKFSLESNKPAPNL